jgi:hypothetical protein
MSLLAFVPGTSAWRRRRDGKLCQEALDHIQELVDRELPSNRLAHLDKHLDACQRCGVEADVIRDLKEAIARVGSECNPDSVAKLEDLARSLCDGESGA